jgi:predicted nucleotidyltransferase component of viral defense system
MDQDSLRKLAGKYKVPLGTIEKDYVVTNLLLAISRFPKINKMVFKGGTAIKKIYFRDARFSEDIDFTCKEDISIELCELLKNEIEKIDVNFKEVKVLGTKGNSRKFTIKYNDFNDHPNSVKIDLSLREKVMKKTKNLSVLHIYNNLSDNFKILTMSLEEIMTEKIRAIIYSPQSRHLYDIWYLLNKGINLNSALVNKKIGLYNQRFSVDIFLESIKGIKKGWEGDLKALLPQDPPTFDSVSNIVTTAIYSNIRKP